MIGKSRMVGKSKVTGRKKLIGMGITFGKMRIQHKVFSRKNQTGPTIGFQNQIPMKN